MIEILRGQELVASQTPGFLRMQSASISSPSASDDGGELLCLPPGSLPGAHGKGLSWDGSSAPPGPARTAVHALVEDALAFVATSGVTGPAAPRGEISLSLSHGICALWNLIC